MIGFRNGRARWKALAAVCVGRVPRFGGPTRRFLAALAVLLAAAPAASAEPVTIVGLGDSLMAGYELAPDEAFPARLEAALAERGHDVEVVNAGVSGDTTSGGLSRLDWSVPDGTDAVIVELGANDALRGISPEQTLANLDMILERLDARGLPVLLAGMMAPPNMGEDYAARFNAIYESLAGEHDVVFYPFFLDGVALDPALNLADGLHPNADGIAVMVQRFLPYAERLLSRIAENSGN